MLNFYFLFLCAFLYSSNGAVLTIENIDYSLHDFFSRYPKKQWERADSLQKEKMIDGFIKRKLCVLEAKNLGFQNNPDVAIKIYSRSLQVLVNESYEYFVALPLIKPGDIDLARINAKKEVFVSHILVGHSGSYLARPPQRTLDDALNLSQQIKSDFDGGADFSVLAEKYSDDPGATTNIGEVGWIKWGATVPEFQLVAFSLDRGVLSSPVLTNFGYHLILVSDVRPSDYQYMDDEAYESLIINITKNSIRDKLQSAAIEYDKKMIEDFGVVFNMSAIGKVLKAYNQYQENIDLSIGSGGSSFFLETIDPPGLLCVYNKKGYGSKWFSARLKHTPPSRQPHLETEDLIISTFKTIILQDIAINKGLQFGVDRSFSYQWKINELVSDFLYDAYLKHLVDIVQKPDSLSVKHYYEINKNKKFLEEEKITVREIKVSDRGLADSLLLLINSGLDFYSLALQNNSSGSVLNGPFSRDQGRLFFDAASLLKVGDASPIILSSNSSYSIIQLVERFPPRPLGLERVYARIESLLIKEGQDNSKKHGVDGLLDKYSVDRKTSLLY